MVEYSPGDRAHLDVDPVDRAALALACSGCRGQRRRWAHQSRSANDVAGQLRAVGWGTGAALSIPTRAAGLVVLAPTILSLLSVEVGARRCVGHAWLLARAAEARVTVVRLMVEAALADGKETATDRLEFATQLFGAFRYLSAISNNINQMAKATNATRELPEELSVTLGEVRRLAVQINGLLDEVSSR